MDEMRQRPGAQDVLQVEGAPSGTGATSRITAKSQRWNKQIILWLRVFLVAYLIDMMVQVGLAALFITGDVGLLKWHDNNANIILSTLLFFALIPAILLWRPARGSSGPTWWIVVMFLLIETQKTLGYLRLIGLHIMIGVGIFGLTVGLVVWAVMYKHDPYKREAKKAAKKAGK
ncbi:hypothetical protein AOZ06_31995 [Kibdelosporangium phytohabitans]|uniref:Uncharacterized protein n=2 Tax=Kibdelosporangium phytohabitans TaxID=860235 RepID=A0A0N9I4U3_9PSEU|nr:hypothetical protein AOZ06_31995 [Kibdelosporangium phytohabitans]